MTLEERSSTTDSRGMRILIVDDEPLARQRVRHLLDGEPDIDSIDEARNGTEAIEKIEGARPDLVFLDVQMPEIDGFDVIDAVGSDNFPRLIFTTAYDQHALRAFEVNAIDYLLKPVDPDRFRRALDRVRHQDRAAKRLSSELLGLLQSLPTRPKYLERLVVKSGGRIAFVRTEEIDCIEACGNYLRVCLGVTEHLLRMTISAIETRLDPTRFVRIHRSTIVNVERVKELQSTSHGEYTVLLQNGRRLTLSRGYRDRFQSLLDNAGS